jgi:hypothetical protein
VERAMDRMQRDMDHMVQKAARHKVQWERKAQREARRRERWERQYSTEMAGQATEGATEPIEPELDLDEERLSILRMVEQGQISPQEAEMLLDALS